MEATITLEYDDENTAKAIADAVSPDNCKAPSGLSVKTVRKGNAVISEIKAETELATFIATIDDLLSSASTAERAVKVVRGQ